MEFGSKSGHPGLIDASPGVAEVMRRFVEPSGYVPITRATRRPQRGRVWPEERASHEWIRSGNADLFGRSQDV